jgi:hypothetical protein
VTDNRLQITDNRYAAACHHRIDTDPIGPEEVAAEIMAIWEREGRPDKT